MNDINHPSSAEDKAYEENINNLYESVLAETQTVVSGLSERFSNHEDDDGVLDAEELITELTKLTDLGIRMIIHNPNNIHGMSKENLSALQILSLANMNLERGSLESVSDLFDTLAIEMMIAAAFIQSDNISLRYQIPEIKNNLEHMVKLIGEVSEG